MNKRGAQVVGFFLVSSAWPAFGQTDLERATAREAADTGRTAYDAGRYEQAVDSFSRAQQLVQAPTHLLYLARAQTKLGRLVAAHESYLKITRETLPPKAPKAFVEAQRAAEHELEAVDARLPSVTVAVQGKPMVGVGVQLDGADLPGAMIGIPLPLDPGRHVFSATATGGDSAPVTITLAEGGKETVMLTLRPTGPASALGVGEPRTIPPVAPPNADRSSSPNSGLRIASYVSFGIGAVGLGLGTAFVLKSGTTRDAANNLYDACASAGSDGRCTDLSQRAAIESKDNDADSQRNVGIGALIAGGVGVTAGVIFLVASSGRSHASESSGLHVMPTFGLRSLGLVGTF